MSPAGLHVEVRTPLELVGRWRLAQGHVWTMVRFRFSTQPSVHRQHILSHTQCHTVMPSLTYGHQTPPHRLLNAALHHKPLIERCGTAPPCCTHCTLLPLLLDHNSNLLLHSVLTQWMDFSPCHGFYHVNDHVYFWCTVCTHAPLTCDSLQKAPHCVSDLFFMPLYKQLSAVLSWKASIV